MKNTLIYHIYGIPGSGKTAFSKQIQKELRDLDISLALLDDDLLMGIEKSDAKKIVRILKKQCDIIILCSVVKPFIKGSSGIRLDCSYKTAKQRHDEVETKGSDNYKEYFKYWIPWSKGDDYVASYNTVSTNTQELYKQFYNDVLSYDLNKIV